MIEWKPKKAEGQNPKMNFSGAKPPFSGSNYVKTFLQAVVTVEESATRHSKKKLWTTFQMVKKCQTFFAVSSDKSRPCACSQHVQNCLHGKDLTLSGSNKWLKTLVIEAYDCCAASAQAVHKTSSCFFHVGQISHQHFSHQCSDLLIHSLKASQLGDDVIEDVFPDMFPAWTHRVATPNPQYPSKSEQNNPESLKTKTLKRTAACRVGQ